jgi:hypothetical protein
LNYLRGYIIAIWFCALLVGCTQQPQQVRRLSDKQEPDSALMAQMAFNMQMASDADQACSDWVKQDSAAYVLDEFGFWYSKTIKQQTELLQTGEAISIHLLMAELNGQILADIEDVFAVDSGDLPTAINRCLRQMRRGEQMRIVAPWYTAYGIEGTNIIKPYTNLVITLTISNE